MLEGIIRAYTIEKDKPKKYFTPEDIIAETKSITKAILVSAYVGYFKAGFVKDFKFNANYNELMKDRLFQKLVEDEVDDFIQLFDRRELQKSIVKEIKENLLSYNQRDDK